MTLWSKYTSYKLENRDFGSLSNFPKNILQRTGRERTPNQSLGSKDCNLKTAAIDGEADDNNEHNIPFIDKVLFSQQSLNICINSLE